MSSVLRLLAAHAILSALALTQPAKALLVYKISEVGSDVVVQASGSLNLTGAPIITGSFGPCPGAIFSSLAGICTGTPAVSPSAFAISGPTTFDGTVSISTPSSTSGLATGMLGSALGGPSGIFSIDPAYAYGSPILSNTTFSGTTLAALGFTPGLSGLIGTWAITGTSETIQVFLGPPSASNPVPGPLPLLGAAAAFGWSRRLRRRVGAC
jgi:hypothetical protein